MRFAYADPPYLGCGQSRYGFPEWDEPERHRQLVEQLVAEYPDGWALSLHVPSLRVILPMCPPECRVAAWVKPFAVFRRGVNPAYAWEPVIFVGGRKRDRTIPTVRDWFSANITMKKGLCGAKPPKFCDWIFEMLGMLPGVDEFVDMFPGTGVVTARWATYQPPVQKPKVTPQ